MITFLALAHMLDAAQLVWGGGDDNVPCTCTHVECYATGLGWGRGMTTFIALAHMLNASQLVWGGGDDNVPCACTHVECCAAGLGWWGEKKCGQGLVDRARTCGPTCEKCLLSEIKAPGVTLQIQARP